MAENSSLTRTLLITVATVIITGVSGLLFAILHNRIGIDSSGHAIEKEPKTESHGGRPPPQPSRRVVKAPLDVMNVMAADLEEAGKIPAKQRRYLTLTHLHNNPEISKEALQSWRDAILQLPGLLTPADRVATVRPLDKDATVYAMDLGELGWDGDRSWRLVLREYPYGLSHAKSANDKLVAAEQRIEELSGSKIAQVRGDWFLAAILRKPLGGPDGSLRLPAREVPATIRSVVQGYDSQELNLKAAAVELGLSDAGRLDVELRGEPRYRAVFKLEPLVEGSTIHRNVWESMEFVNSPFQELSNALHLGTPLHVQ